MNSDGVIAYLEMKIKDGNENEDELNFYIDYRNSGVAAFDKHKNVVRRLHKQIKQYWS